MGSPATGGPLRLLIINPNTSQSMTEALKPMVENLGFGNVEYTYFTCPSTDAVPGIPSINSPADSYHSASICLPHLYPFFSNHDAFLVACYSAHPLVPILHKQFEVMADTPADGSASRKTNKYVTGIFEASVTTSLVLLGGAAPNKQFGIVTTGAVWEAVLSEGVHKYIGPTTRFAGVTTTGLNAVELHDLPADKVRTKMVDATKKLVRRRHDSDTEVAAVCLGCAGMVGLESAVRQGCVEALGRVDGQKVKIVDGVKAGVGQLIAMARGGF